MKQSENNTGIMRGYGSALSGNDTYVRPNQSAMSVLPGFMTGASNIEGTAKLPQKPKKKKKTTHP